MKKINQLGIYMDHAHAFLMELENELIISRNILSEWKETPEVVNQDSHFMGSHSAERKHLQMVFYREISDIIRHYQQVVLFGPTDAKNELFNLIKDNYLFTNIKKDLIDTDKLTVAEMHDFVKEYYK